MKLKDDTSVRVDEAASYLRKQLAMNADKCWGDGGKGFTPDPKCMLIKSLQVTKADLYAESVDWDNEIRTNLCYFQSLTSVEGTGVGLDCM